jgi:23S rRNA C2498 (ribose-2'-O)-methylase RlmM
MKKRYSEGRKKLEKIKQKVLEEVAGCAVSSDQFSRVSILP